MAKSFQDRKARGKASVELDCKKHKIYKLFAVKNGLKLKELAELALDEYIKAK